MTDGSGKTPCIWLPTVNGRLGPESTRVHSRDKGAEFYLATLRYSQSLWLEGKPAQAILQLNKAWMADLKGDERVLRDFPPPYRALIWLLRQAKAGDAGFLGNPVRHFQHLATRMSGPRSEIRAWRAWACLDLSELELPRGTFPRDGEQRVREGLWVPGRGRVLREISRLGWNGEIDELLQAAEDSAQDATGSRASGDLI